MFMWQSLLQKGFEIAAFAGRTIIFKHALTSLHDLKNRDIY